MTVEDFVKDVKDGEYRHPGSGVSSGGIVEGETKLSPADVDGITAEAFNIGVLDSEEVSWDEGVGLIRKALDADPPK